MSDIPISSLDRRELKERIVSAAAVFVSSSKSRDEFSQHPLSKEFTATVERLGTDTGRNYQFSFSVFLMGDSKIGKSSFQLRLSDNRFHPPSIKTHLFDFRCLRRGFCDRTCIPCVKPDPVQVKVRIFDIFDSGTYNKRQLLPFSRIMDGIFLLFDVTNRSTFESLPQYFSLIEQHFAADITVILIGMKSDIDELQSGCSCTNLVRSVMFDEAIEYAREMNVPYLECSAKTSSRMNDALATMIYHIFLQNPDIPEVDHSSKTKGHSVCSVC